MENLRIPYQGSKNAIAETLIYKMREYKPNAKYFYDLFGGGGAMSFKALQMGYTVIYNEYDSGLTVLLNYILNRIKNNQRSKYGLFPEEFYNFVTREEFIKQKDLCTPYAEFIKIVYSFGNNRKDYLFNPELEKIKHIMHDVVVFRNKKELKKLNIILNTNFIIPEELTINERRLNLGRQIKSNNKRIDLQQLEQLERLTVLNKSYDKVPIPLKDEEVIVYCDPPYRKTANYKIDFDCNKFDEWVKNSDKTIFISEYNAPFDEIMAIKKRCTLSAAGNYERIEKLFISKNS